MRISTSFTTMAFLTELKATTHRGFQP